MTDTVNIGNEGANDIYISRDEYIQERLSKLPDNGGLGTSDPNTVNTLFSLNEAASQQDVERMQAEVSKARERFMSNWQGYRPIPT